MKTDSFSGVCAAIALLSSLAIPAAAVRAEAAPPGLTFPPNPHTPAWLSAEAAFAGPQTEWWDSDASHWDRFPGGDLWSDYCDEVSCQGRHATVALGPHACRTAAGEAGGCPPPRPVWNFVRDLLGWRTCWCANSCGGTRPPRGSFQPSPVAPGPTPASEPTDMTADIESLDQNTTGDLSRHNRPRTDGGDPLPWATDPADPAPTVPRESAVERADLTDDMDLQPVPVDDPPPVPPEPADADRTTPVPRNELPPMEPTEPEVSRRDRSVPRMANRLSDYIQTR